jgi:two-component system nitrogen regulation response regulator NtrX
MSAIILIVDDEEAILKALSGPLKREGYEVTTAKSAAEAKKANSRVYPLQVHVMMSGHSTIDTAVKAVKLGAYDFLEKPLSLERVLITIENGLKVRSLARENLSFKREIASKYELVGESDEIEDLKTQIDRVARSNSRVLIQGENGTGKEIVARNIFYKSARAEKPFVAVNCAALPEELIESELFGFQKGAFTGATFSRGGRFEEADKGILFLDEIGDMSAKTQAKLLRVIEEGEVERLGGGNPKKIDVRILAATNKNLVMRVERGDFREDLYFRINVIPIMVPPLRQHKEDIPILADHFIDRLCKEYGRRKVKLLRAAEKALLRYNYPGNVRELKNIIERLLVTGEFADIGKDDVDFVLSTASLKGQTVDLKTALSTASLKGQTVDLKTAVEQFERRYIIAKIKEANGNMADAARRLGLERSHLYKKMKALDIEI